MRSFFIHITSSSFISYFLSISASLSADVTVLQAQKLSDINVISITGSLIRGDENKFIDAALRNPAAIVVLDSDGGDLTAGLEIGKAIHLKGFVTLVPEGGRCASACALAWLAGRVRGMSDHSLIGFHAAYLGGTGEVASAGNAIVGSYLTQLGLPTSAIVYITSSKPSEMQWLTSEDADRYGIPVKIFPSKTQQPPAANSIPPVLPPTPANVAPSTTQTDTTRESTPENIFLKALYSEIEKHTPENNTMRDGEVTVSFRVNSSGRVDSIVIDKTTSPELSQTVRQILKAVVAPPPPGGSINVGQTFRFHK